MLKFSSVFATVVADIEGSNLNQQFVLSTTPVGEINPSYEFEDGITSFGSERERDEFSKWMRYVHAQASEFSCQSLEGGLDSVGVDIWNHAIVKNLRKHRFQLREYFDQLCSYEEIED